MINIAQLSHDYVMIGYSIVNFTRFNARLADFIAYGDTRLVSSQSPRQYYNLFR